MNNKKLIDYAKESAKAVNNVVYTGIKRKCMYQGCPMNATLLSADGNKCDYHDTGDFHQDVTESIINNLKFIKAYSKMTKWEGEQWQEQECWLLQNAHCPMIKGEAHSIYLVRYLAWIDDKIRNEAVESINKRNQMQSIGTYIEGDKG